MAYTENYILGDANRDGRVNAKDIAMIMYYMVCEKDAKKDNVPLDKEHFPKLARFNKKAANYYADSDTINSRDIIELMKYIVSKPIA